ncbi:hypothetical protein Bca101_017258 [Brassica carinata]
MLFYPLARVNPNWKIEKRSVPPLLRFFFFSVKDLGSTSINLFPLFSTLQSRLNGFFSFSLNTNGGCRPIGSAKPACRSVSLRRCRLGKLGKAIASGNNVVKEITFKDVTFGPHEGEVRFRLIHFWEAWNLRTKTLIGPRCSSSIGMVIQGFIPQGRIEVYLRHLKAGALYRLNKSSVRFPDDRYRVHGYEEFDAACDLRGQLYDYVGHIKLLNGQVPSDGLRLDESEIAASRRVDLHVQTHDFEFCEKFNASEGTARVILVTTLNPKRFGVLTLSSMAPSRVFLDNDVEETRVYLSWLNSNLDVASRVNAEVITKPEPASLGELFSYMKKATAKVAWFECTATIDAVVHGSEWYYIGCAVCHTKATRGPTTLMCKKCGKAEIVGVAHYLSKLSVYDHNDQGVFVLLGDAGEELTGKKAGELVEGYYQANEGLEGDHMVPVPQAMIDTIGQTRKFVVKVSKHNLEAKTQTLTVTKVLPIETPEPRASLGEEVDEEPDGGSETRGEEAVKRGTDVSVPDGVKRARCG